MPEVMAAPNEEKWKEIASEFWTSWNFPNCLGAIDGKHVTIQAPPNSGSQYFCYKKTFSVVLLALVDAHYNFIAVDVGSYGKNSDGGILNHSMLGKALEQNKLDIPEKAALPGTTNEVPFVIIGDEAFPLKTYLLRPYPGKNLDCNEKRIYNYRICRARRVVENAFGILSQKFRIYNRRIQAKPENVDVIIITTCILHNFIKKYDGKLTYIRDNQQFNADQLSVTTLTNIPIRGGNATREAFFIRNTFKDFFNSSIGSIPWQNNV
eukprot:XP_016656379.1 PREDICTED: uncharacterized protein LOC107882497 [Acyrthosiphon pisum]